MPKSNTKNTHRNENKRPADAEEGLFEFHSVTPRPSSSMTETNTTVTTEVSSNKRLRSNELDLLTDFSEIEKLEDDNLLNEMTEELTRDISPTIQTSTTSTTAALSVSLAAVSRNSSLKIKEGSAKTRALIGSKLTLADNGYGFLTDIIEYDNTIEFILSDKKINEKNAMISSIRHLLKKIGSTPMIKQIVVDPWLKNGFKVHFHPEIKQKYKFLIALLEFKRSKDSSDLDELINKCKQLPDTAYIAKYSRKNQTKDQSTLPSNSTVQNTDSRQSLVEKLRLRSENGWLASIDETKSGIIKLFCPEPRGVLKAYIKAMLLKYNKFIPNALQLSYGLDKSIILKLPLEVTNKMQFLRELSSHQKEVEKERVIKIFNDAVKKYSQTPLIPTVMLTAPVVDTSSQTTTTTTTTAPSTSDHEVNELLGVQDQMLNDDEPNELLDAQDQMLNDDEPNELLGAQDKILNNDELNELLGAQDQALNEPAQNIDEVTVEALISELRDCPQAKLSNSISSQFNKNTSMVLNSPSAPRENLKKSM